MSKFSKVSLNNLFDITLEPEYSSVCRHTDADLDAVFGPELPGLDRDEIRRWHNGYNWRGAEKVYPGYIIRKDCMGSPIRGICNGVKPLHSQRRRSPWRQTVFRCNSSFKPSERWSAISREAGSAAAWRCCAKPTAHST